MKVDLCSAWYVTGIGIVRLQKQECAECESEYIETIYTNICNAPEPNLNSLNPTKSGGSHHRASPSVTDSARKHFLSAHFVQCYGLHSFYLLSFSAIQANGVRFNHSHAAQFPRFGITYQFQICSTHQ